MSEPAERLRDATDMASGSDRSVFHYSENGQAWQEVSPDSDYPRCHGTGCICGGIGLTCGGCCACLIEKVEVVDEHS